jgi:enolase
MSTNDTITRVHARQVLDSRGNPTVEAEVHCAGGAMGRAIVPSGASTGKHEAVDLRDGIDVLDYGKSVGNALRHVRQVIGPDLTGIPASRQEEIDQRMIALDGTANKSRLGANAILGVSLACAHAAAAARNLPLWRYLDRGRASLPLPMFNMISGGLHAGHKIEFQDFLVMPITATSYSTALRFATVTYRELSEVLRRHGYEGDLVGDEGGFGPQLPSNEAAIELILEANNRVAWYPDDIAIGIDVASSRLFRDGEYHLQSGALSSRRLTALLTDWVSKYPVVSIEDGMAEDDWDGWKLLTKELGNKVQLIGDDLFTTNPERLQRGIDEKVANAILIKPNQIGTLTETLAVIEQARAAGYRTIISARSGETEDTTIADLAVATGAGQIKIGSVARSERLAKYNQLLRIEEQMGPNAPFAKWQPIG